MADALALCVSHPGPVACGSTHYDVFLSFPGGSDATPESFPRRLHACLAAAGVSVCRPDESQAIGSSSSLLADAAVQRSKICIPILSQDYASSDRCLRSLVQMMEGKRSGRQRLLPIFNRVEPSDLRYLKGSFEKARHSDIEGVKEALYGVSMIHGVAVTEWCEEERVKTVVRSVLRCYCPDLQTISQSIRYNVFLNFRGLDTRQNIANYLYKGLMDVGVSVFKDDTDLLIGEDFSSQLFSAISRSTIYITILSEHYAFSKWCLQELIEMFKYQKRDGHLVVPIFYKVEPSMVRHQRGHFEHAFKLQRTRNRYRNSDVAKAEEALRDLSSIKGWVCDFERGRDDNGEEFTGSVVQETLGILRRHFQLDVPDHLFSIDDRLKSD